MMIQITIGMIAFVIGYFVGTILQIRDDERSAVKAGVGEYFINSDNEKEFRFKK